MKSRKKDEVNKITLDKSLSSWSRFYFDKNLFLSEINQNISNKKSHLKNYSHKNLDLDENKLKTMYLYNYIKEEEDLKKYVLNSNYKENDKILFEETFKNKYANNDSKLINEKVDQTITYDQVYSNIVTPNKNHITAKKINLDLTKNI